MRDQNRQATRNQVVELTNQGFTMEEVRRRAAWGRRNEDTIGPYLRLSHPPDPLPPSSQEEKKEEEPSGRARIGETPHNRPPTQTTYSN
jgi:hypothetical protein